MNALIERLKDSENFGDDHTIKLLADKFDETAKKQFRGPKGTGIIKFGTVKDNDPKHGIRAGKLLIPKYLRWSARLKMRAHFY